MNHWKFHTDLTDVSPLDCGVHVRIGVPYWVRMWRETESTPWIYTVHWRDDDELADNHHYDNLSAATDAADRLWEGDRAEFYAEESRA